MLSKYYSDYQKMRWRGFRHV